MIAKEILDAKGRKVYSINENTDVVKAIDQLVDDKIRFLLVFNDNGELSGVIAEGDIVKKALYPKKDIAKLRVKDIMTPRSALLVASETDDIQNLMKIMSDKKVRHLPIFNGTKLAGVVSSGDVIKSMLQAKEYEIQTLTDYISGKSY